MRDKVLVLVCALSLVACVTTHHYLVAEPGSPYTGPVAIHLLGATPKGEFTEVAVIRASLPADLLSHPTVADILRLLEARAAKLGCDAVLYVRIDDGGGISATGMAARSVARTQP